MPVKIKGTYNAKKIASMNRLIVSAWGNDKKGKTHFALTAPGPIVYFDFDDGLEGVVEKFRNQKEIVICNMQFSADDADSKVKWNMFMRVYDDALVDPEVRTIVVDTGTHAWELMRLKHFGRLASMIARKYEKPNAEFRQWINKAKGFNKNLIILHKSGLEYVDDKCTGRQTIKAFNDIGGLAQVNVEVTREGKGGPFKLIIDNCRHDGSKEGEELVEPMCAFPFLAAEVKGNSPGDWE